MSAIGVIYNRAGAPINKHIFHNFALGLERLGPDGGHQLTVNSIGLVYRAFHTTRESHNELQPVISPLGNILVIDGILFNRNELIDLLQNDLRKDRTDAGLISIGLDKYGIDFLSKIIGNFAFAWWEPQKQTLTLARDPFGVRPLFYYYDDNKVIAASDLKPVLDAADISLEIDEEYVAGYLALFPEPNRTPYKKFHAVEPGMIVTVQPTGTPQMRYHWRPDVSKEIRYKTDSEYEEHCKHLMFEAVKGCLRTDNRPIWVSLSGGLDSSSIACIAHELITKGEVDAKQLETCSLVYHKSETSDERRFIVEVEKKLGKQGYHVPEDDYWMNFPSPEKSFIYLPNSTHCTYGRSEYIRNAMQANNARVMLDGNGGDQIFWNMFDASPELADILSKGHLPTLHRRLRYWSKAFKKRYIEQFWNKALVPVLPIKLAARYQKEIKIAEWFEKDFIDRTTFRERIIAPPDPYGLPSFRTRIHSNSILQAIWLIAVHVYFDDEKVEMRYPFFYPPLINFMLSIPFDLIVSSGLTRPIMRKALKDVLPPRILNRKGKTSLEEAFNRGVVTKIKDIINLLSNARVAEYGYVNRDLLLKDIQKVLHGKEMDQAGFINTITLELWLRSFEHHMATKREPALHNSAII